MIEGRIRHHVGEFTLEIEWAVGAGQSMGIIGPSGAGKTTTLRAIAGLLRPSEGQIVIGGQTVFDSTAAIWVPPHQRRVGYMPQRYALFPHLTVEENVAFGLGGWRPRAREARVIDLLERLQIKELATRYPHQISAGQQQRVALGRALAPDPVLLLLDEPFAALDLDLRRNLKQTLLDIRRDSGVTMLLVTHDPSDAMTLTDQVIAMEDGRVVAQGPPMDVLNRPAAQPISQLTQVENVFLGTVTETSPSDGLMTCDLDGVTLVAPFADLQQGDAVRIGIRAGDILLSTKPPSGLSAQNVLAGAVTSIEARGFEAEVIVDCGRPFRAEVTPRAVKQLGLAPGMAVWLIIKSNSCFVLE